jgi:dTDP-4-amino-4,6-dideoxygalactose transaminase
VLSSGHLSGAGEYSKLAESMLSELTSGQPHLLTPSCSHALELSIRALDIGPGDEVIIPSFNFTSAANAIVLAGAKPVFVDTESKTHCLDVDLVAAAITPNTKAVIVVHYGGVGFKLHELVELCKKHNLYLIEDNAHGLGGVYDGKKLGTFGDLATYSFHETKNIHSGEGGSISFKDPKIRDKLEILRQKGTDRSRFSRGLVDKYTWQDAGSSWIQSDILAAFLVSQLESFESIQEIRHSIWSKYHQGLEDWAKENKFALLDPIANSGHTAHLFSIVFEEAIQQTEFISYMAENGVSTPFHYQALHESHAGLIYGRSIGDFENTKRAASRLVRLPLWPGMSEPQIAKVIELTIRFKSSGRLN